MTTQEAPRALIALAPNDHHDVGPRMLADALEADGWEVDFCGVAATTEDVIAAVRERRPRFIGISCSLLRFLDDVRELIGALRAEFGDALPPVVVGGQAFEGDPEVWKRTGADAGATERGGAVELLRVYKG
jgi:MerR family transcriptional regulator, light-induced transcriptional regulator